MSRRSGRVWIWLVMISAAVALAPGLAACGGGPPALSTPSTAPSADGPGPTPTAAPTPAPSKTASPSPTPSASRSSAAPTPSPSPSRPCPADSTVRAWYYVPNDVHRTPEVPDEVQRLLRTYGGRYVGDTGEKVVYLTFDEGYENGFTGRILDALRTADVQATFFVTGSYVRANPDLVRRMAGEGHVIANHTDGHPSLPSLASDSTAFERELTATEQAFERVTGSTMARLLRPPMGEYSARSLCLTQRLGYQTVFWSFAHRDWLVDEQPPVAVTLERLLEGRHDGAIYLLHAVSSSNSEALPRFIEEMEGRGYRFGVLKELLP